MNNNFNIDKSIGVKIKTFNKSSIDWKQLEYDTEMLINLSIKIAKKYDLRVSPETVLSVILNLLNAGVD